jgi:hypothetical protein
MGSGGRFVKPVTGCKKLQFFVGNLWNPVEKCPSYPQKRIRVVEILIATAFFVLIATTFFASIVNLNRHLSALQRIAI